MQTFSRPAATNDVDYNREVFNKITVAAREYAELAVSNLTPLSAKSPYSELTGGDVEYAQRNARKSHQLSTLLIKLMDGEISAAAADAQYAKIKNR